MKKLLRKFVLWGSHKFSSRPSRPRIFKALDELFRDIENGATNRGLVIPFEHQTGRFIIFSDQHKGAGNGADDFVSAVPNYLAALNYYNDHGFTLVNLGDNEELWESRLIPVKKFHSASFDAERKFVEREAFVKIFGNHDLFWTDDPSAFWHLRDVFKVWLKVYEGVVLATLINGKQFYIRCTHGHQGDRSSDGNWFSRFFVSRVWAPLQIWLQINPNTPAYDNELKTLHNEIMYDWSEQHSDGILVTGHTHQPVFASLTHLERLYKEYELAKRDNDRLSITRLEAEIKKREREYTAVSMKYSEMKPTYFNSGCCCMPDGDMTGLEIADGMIRLVKWTSVPNGPQRMVLEERELSAL